MVEFEDMAAEDFVLGTQHRDLFGEFTVTLYGHSKFGAQRLDCRRASGEYVRVARRMGAVLTDFAPKFGVLIQEAGRYSGGAGNRDERDQLAGIA